MTRNLLEVPRDPRLVDEEGRINSAWLRQFEELFIIVQHLANSMDAATGSSTGNDVDTEWNVLVNSIKQD